jgi:hypothetical protein
MRNHGLLHSWNGAPAFGFIHGNWALDNSRPDGRWCGLNNELSILKKLGCYADFTLPSAPSMTQVRTINKIYWATDDPSKPKSHDIGVSLCPGGGRDGDLLLIPGPLGLRWANGRSWKLRLETGELAGYDMPVRGRAPLWFKLAPRIGNDIFVKLFGHGMQEFNSGPLLGGGFDVLFTELRRECEARDWSLFYVSAWEMFQAVEAVRERRDPVATLH